MSGASGSDLELVRLARGAAGTSAGEQKTATGHIDRRPTCQHCGRRVGDYFGRPWSVRCLACGRQARRD